MPKYPTIYRLNDLQRTIRDTAAVVDGVYVPARPMGFASIQNRLRCAYAVFTGRADAVVWPEDEWEAAGKEVATSVHRVGGAA